MGRRNRGNYMEMIDKIKDSDKKPSYNNDDPTEFKPTYKEDGTSNVIVRFLPPHIEEDLPFVKVYSHGWPDKNGWFIDPCPTTIGKDCPICKENGRVWEFNENLARKRSRKLSFWANIMVVKDPQCPENEGKVFKYRYGVKIHEKIMEKLNPSEPEIDPMVPIFDYEKGANFKLKIKTTLTTIDGKEKKMPNYDASVFAEPTPIGLGAKAFTDEELDELDAKLHKLKGYADPKIFSSYEQLAIKFTKKTGIAISTDPDIESVVNESAPAETPKDEPKEKETPKRSEPEVGTDNGMDDDSGDDANASFFANLAKENSSEEEK